MNEINLSNLRQCREIRFDPELNHSIYKKTKEFMSDLVTETDILKRIYRELSKDEIEQIFLGTTKFQSLVSSDDILDAICEMNAVDFNDGEMKQLDKNQHHGKKAKMDIQKERELQIKDLEGPNMAGVAGPAR